MVKSILHSVANWAPTAFVVGLLAFATSSISAGEPYWEGAHRGGCASCGSGRHGRACSCCNRNVEKCRTCPPNPTKVDCCDHCGNSGLRIFGCGWRKWDLLGYWSCGNGCGSACGCGEIYRGDYASDPPDCCDPCDRHGNWVGPAYTGYRAPYRTQRYAGGHVYDPSMDFGYGGMDVEEHYPSYSSQPTYAQPMMEEVSPQPMSAPSRLVPSSTRRPSTPMQSQKSQARQPSRFRTY